MTVTVEWTITPQAPKHGETVRVTYQVTGNDDTPGDTLTVTGDVTVGEVPYDLVGSLTGPGTPALPVTYAPPTCPGLIFKPTVDPAVFTAVVP